MGGIVSASALQVVGRFLMVRLLTFSHVGCNRVSLLLEKISEDGCKYYATCRGSTPLSKEVST